MVSVVLPSTVQDTAVVTVCIGLAVLAYKLSRPSTKSTADPNAKPRRQILTLESSRPAIGDLPEFARNAERMHEWMAERSLQFKGEPWRIRIPGLKDMIVVTSPELVEEVMTTQFDNFPRGEQQSEVLEDLVGDSLIAADGEKWYHQRKTAVRFFTARALRGLMTKSIRSNLAEVYDVIDARMATQEPVDLVKLFHEFTMQTFAEAGLGVKLDVIGSREPQPLDALFGTSPVFVRRMKLPSFYWKLERWLKVGPEGQVARAMATTRAWLQSVITESLEAATKKQADSAGLQGDGETKSIVEQFLEQSSEDKLGLKAENLVDFILTFVLTARGTSAVTLLWIFLVLTQNPRVENRLREELSKALPHLTSESYITGDDIAGLTYLDATIKEVLRLYPTLPAMHKEAAQDTELSDGLSVKKGEIVALATYAIARMPNVWGSDAAEFKPERWIDEKTGALHVVASSKFLSFGSGPRICIGQKLAMLELRVTVANLLNRYRFTLAQPNDLSHTIGLELFPAQPVLIHAKRVHPQAAAA